MRLIDADALKEKISEAHFKTYGNAMKCIMEAPTVDAVPIDADLGMMLNCAVRYTCGRRTYMPYIVINYITPLILHLDDATLAIIDKDLDEAARTGGYGDPQIDEPRWKAFHALIQQERLLRAGHHCKERGDSDV